MHHSSHFEEESELENPKWNNLARAHSSNSLDATQQVAVFTKALEEMNGMVRNLSKQMATLEGKIASGSHGKQTKSPSLTVRVSIYV